MSNIANQATTKRNGPARRKSLHSTNRESGFGYDFAMELEALTISDVQDFFSTSFGKRIKSFERF